MVAKGPEETSSLDNRTLHDQREGRGWEASDLSFRNVIELQYVSRKLSVVAHGTFFALGGGGGGVGEGEGGKGRGEEGVGG